MKLGAVRRAEVWVPGTYEYELIKQNVINLSIVKTMTLKVMKIRDL